MIILICLFIFDYIVSYKEVDIIKTWAVDYKGNDIMNADKPVNGNDYWLSGIIYKGEYAEWMCEIEKLSLIKQVYIEFNTPPDCVEVFATISYEKSIYHPIGYYTYNNKNNKLNRNSNYYYDYYTSPVEINVQTMMAFKYVKLRFRNMYNDAIVVNMIKVKLFSDEDKMSKYLLAYIDSGNNGMNTYNEYEKLIGVYRNFKQKCLFYDNNNNKFTIIECNNCLRYDVISSCIFDYVGIDNETNNYIFEIHNKTFTFDNIYNTYNNNSNSFINTNYYITDDYIIEINSTSVHNETFNIHNILHNNIHSYWSSAIQYKPLCNNIYITLTLKQEYIIRDIYIHFIHMPHKYKITFITNHNISKSLTWTYIDTISKETHYSNNNIYLKAKQIIIEFAYDNEDLINKICLTSIKTLRILIDDYDKVDKAFYLINIDQTKYKDIIKGVNEFNGVVREFNNVYKKLMKLNLTLQGGLMLNNEFMIIEKKVYDIFNKYKMLQQMYSILYKDVKDLVINNNITLTHYNISQNECEYTYKINTHNINNITSTINSLLNITSSSKHTLLSFSNQYYSLYKTTHQLYQSLITTLPPNPFTINPHIQNNIQHLISLSTQHFPSSFPYTTFPLLTPSSPFKSLLNLLPILHSINLCTLNSILNNIIDKSEIINK